MDYIYCHPDEQIAPEKKKKMTFFVFNDQVTSEEQLRKLVDETLQKTISDTALAPSDLAGLVDHEITQPYPF